MKRIVICAVLALLAGCANFKLGSLMYCQSNADCTFTQTAKP